MIDRIVSLVYWAEMYKDPTSFIEISRVLNNELRQTIDHFIDEVIAKKLREINNNESLSSVQKRKRQNGGGNDRAEWFIRGCQG